MHKNIIIIGPQGSGKGTQAKLLNERFGYFVLGTGDALREIAKEDTPLGRKVHQTINVQGLLVEPGLIANVVKERLQKLNTDQKVVIDGFPRSLEQYALMKEFWSSLDRGVYTVIYISLSEDEAVRRLSNRYICEMCGHNHVGKKEACEKCGGKLIQRDDDRPEAVRTRLALFKKETVPVIDAMRKDKEEVFDIDGSLSIEEVHEQIVNKLGL